MKPFLIFAFIIFINGLEMVIGSMNLPWPIYCQTLSGEFCNIELNERKLFCPSKCSENVYENSSSQLIVDLAVLDNNSLQHSRVRRQTSPLDVFTTTMFLEFARMFFDASIR